MIALTTLDTITDEQIRGLLGQAIAACDDDRILLCRAALNKPVTAGRRAIVERAIGAKLRYGWSLDGAGPARYGFASIHPCRDRWEGRTLQEIARRLCASVIARAEVEALTVDSQSAIERLDDERAID